MEVLRRKRLLINPQFQGRFALFAIVTTLLMVPIFIVANYYFFNLFAEKSRALGLPADHELMLFVERQQKLMALVFIGATLLAILINVVSSYFFSHRIAGSIFRLTSSMNQATDIRSAKTIQPRDEDFFQETHEAYNRLIERSNS